MLCDSRDKIWEHSKIGIWCSIGHQKIIFGITELRFFIFANFNENWEHKETKPSWCFKTYSENEIIHVNNKHNIAIFGKIILHKQMQKLRFERKPLHPKIIFGITELSFSIFASINENGAVSQRNETLLVF